MNAGDRDVLAIDLGSSWIKFGWFPASGECASPPTPSSLAISAPPLPTPSDVGRVEHRGRTADAWGAEIDRWFDETALDAATWCVIGSVQPKIAAALVERLQARGFRRIKLVTVKDLRLEVRTTEPTRVGIDRLLGALAVNRLRARQVAAITVDMGTATTVDVVSPDGAFEGGAILAGPWLSLSALHAGTASLPAMGVGELGQPPAAVGKSTEQALAAGAFWGAVGAVNELVRRSAKQLPGEPEVSLTGGAAPAFASLIELDGRPARHVPHLVLAGLRIAADELPT
jgi:type III pantothenate kinase